MLKASAILLAIIITFRFYAFLSCIFSLAKDISPFRLGVSNIINALSSIFVRKASDSKANPSCLMLTYRLSSF